MKRRLDLIPVLLLLASCLSLAQEQNAKLTIKAALVDKDLNVKPVPKLALTLRAARGGAVVNAVTGFNGTAEVELPAGKYHVKNPQPVEFQGKKYSWEVDLQVKPGQNLLELSSDNALATEAPATPAGRKTDELSAQFKRLQNSVVTVWSEIGSGTGFLIEPRGLIITNQHVIAKSDIISVQFDSKRKVSAILLASDPQKDVAVLWANLSGLPEAITAPMLEKNEAAVVEGERVMTIGSPLSQRKILTTGIVSKVEARAIISDIRIDRGNSGGPLFNSLGKVVGITTFGQSGGGGGGVSGIVRIEEAMSVIEEAKKKKVAVLTNPAPDLLPVEPEGTFPLDALKRALQQSKFDTKPYRFEAGDYSVLVITPQLRYYYEEEDKIQAAKAKNKRNKTAASEEQESDASDDLKSWGEYAGEYKAVISVRAVPKLRETTGSKWRRGMLGVAGGPATIRFKTDFYKMKLRCGEKEVAPIHPGKIPLVFNERNWMVNLTDATFAGWYSYGPDAISPSCGQITLELYAANSPAPITVKTLDAKTVSRVWDDFEPYRAAQKKSDH